MIRNLSTDIDHNTAVIALLQQALAMLDASSDHAAAAHVASAIATLEPDSR